MTRRPKPTIYEALIVKLGRIPSSAEIAAECRRILAEGAVERAEVAPSPYGGPMAADIVERLKAELRAVYIEGDHLRPIIEDAADTIERLRASNERMREALGKLLAADDAMLAFLLVADAKQIGEAEWDRQHKERSDRKRRALEAARSALSLIKFSSDE